MLALNIATNADQAWTTISEMRHVSPRPRTPEVKTIAADMCETLVPEATFLDEGLFEFGELTVEKVLSGLIRPIRH